MQPRLLRVQDLRQVTVAHCHQCLHASRPVGDHLAGVAEGAETEAVMMAEVQNHLVDHLVEPPARDRAELRIAAIAATLFRTEHMFLNVAVAR